MDSLRQTPLESTWEVRQIIAGMTDWNGRFMGSLSKHGVGFFNGLLASADGREPIDIVTPL
jgi:hypothetical protein